MSPSFIFEGKEASFFYAQQEPRFLFKEPRTSSLLTKDILKSENALIRSDNLDALQYFNKINTTFDIIYIDPPYNTGLKFTYNDNFSVNKEKNNKNSIILNNSEPWLCMMYPRLLLAKNILDESGVLYISIDDREFAHLNVLLNEIFGKENHIGTIKWRKKNKPSFLDKHIGNVIEYIIVFAKNHNKLAKLIAHKSSEKSRPVLNASNPISKRILKAGTPAYCKEGIYKKGNYINRTLSFECLEDLIIENQLIKKDIETLGRFRVSQEILNKSVYITKNFGLRRVVLEKEQVFRHATDDATIDFESNEDAQNQIKELFKCENIFDFPKPVGLIKKLVKMYQPNSQVKKINCLDFFAGSATLAQAVHELNYNQDKIYTFCCVQKDEKINKISTFPNLNTVADIAEKRIELIEKKYQIFPRCKVFIPFSQN